MMTDNNKTHHEESPVQYGKDATMFKKGKTISSKVVRIA